MFSTYFLLVFLNFGMCWSYLVIPFDGNLHTPESAAVLEDVGEPLILTPLIESNDIERAWNLSAVVPLLDGSDIVSYSGYLTVNKTCNSNLFFWFFPKNGDGWQNAPLLLWLQGGPGASSLYGLFEENGPYMYNTSKTRLELRNNSWTNDYNVLYIDQPVGTGFSFTDLPSGYIRTQEEVADHLYEALTQFFQLFPQLRANKFYITGESFAGRYIPAISYKIHTMKMANLTDINLKGLFMISPSTNGLLNGLANFCFQNGIIDSVTKDEVEKIEKQIESYIHSGFWSNATDSTGELLKEIVIGSNVSAYDYREYNRGLKTEDWDYAEFLKLPDIRMKIHVGNISYSGLSTEVLQYFWEDLTKSVKSWLEALLGYYPVAFVEGQYDIRVAHPLVEKVLENLDWRGAYSYRTNKIRNRFKVEGVDSGYYKRTSNLTYYLIRGAGHMVPKDQPKAALTALNTFVNN